MGTGISKAAQQRCQEIKPVKARDALSVLTWCDALVAIICASRTNVFVAFLTTARGCGLLITQSLEKEEAPASSYTYMSFIRLGGSHAGFSG
jgi:hypothetical protein